MKCPNSRPCKKSAKALMLLAAAGATAISIQPTASGQLYWDINGSTSGAGGTAPSGTWDLSNLNWNASSLGTSAGTTWAAGSTAVFSSGTNATGAYTITIAPGVSIPGVNGISFEEGSPTIASGDAASNLVLTSPSITTIGGTTSIATISTSIGGTVGLTRIGGTGTLATVGTGTLVLSGSNTYTGVTTISSTGRIVATNSNAFGSTAAVDNIIFNPAFAVASPSFIGGGISLAGNINIGKAITINGGSGATTGAGQIDNLSGSNTWSGPITIGSTVQNLGSGLPMISATAGTLVISQGITPVGAVSPSSGIGFTGGGTIVLQGSATYTGITRLFGGHIILETGNALGPSNASGVFAVGITATSNQGSLPVLIGLRPGNGAPGMTVPTPIGQLSGMPDVGKGLLDNLAGSNTYTGAIVISNAAPFNIANPVIPTPIGVSAGSLRITSAITSSTSNQRSFVKVGPGPLELSGSTSFTGPSIVEAGTLSFVGLNGSNTSNISTLYTGATNTAYGNSFLFNAGTSLRFDNTEGARSNRIAQNSGNTGLAFPVLLNGADFSVLGNGTTAVNITAVGTELDLFGTTSLSFSQPGAGVTLNVAATNRKSNSTVLFRGAEIGIGGAGAGVSTVLLPSGLQTLSSAAGTAGTPSIGILPWAVGDSSAIGSGTDFVTYDATNGVRLLAAGEYNTTNLIDGAVSDNYQLTSAGSITVPTTVNSLKLGSGATSVSLGSQLNVTSGAILNASGSTATISGSSALNFGSQEGVVHAVTDVLISAPITASGGLTKGSGGNLTLTNAANSISTLTLDGGNIIADSEGALGGASSALVLNGGFLQPSAGLTSIANTHSITAASAGGVNVPSGQTLQVDAAIAGVGSFQKVGGGTLKLTGTNTGLTGSVVLRAGTLEVSSENNLSSLTTVAQNGVGNNSADIRFEGGALHATSNVTFAGSATASNLTAAQHLYFATEGIIDVDGNATVRVPTLMYGPGSLTKTGNGTLIVANSLTQNNVLFGRTTKILGGVAGYTNQASLPYQAGNVTPDYFFLDNGGALQLFFSTTAATRGITIGANGGGIDVDGTGTFSYSSVIAGSGSLTKIGTGTFAPAVANTYAGGSVVKAGWLSVNNDNRLGLTGTNVTLDGGTLALSTLVGLTRPIVVTAAGGTLDNGTNSANNTGFSISGAGVLSKFGSALFSTNVVNTGGINIQAGTLQVLSGRSVSTKTSSTAALTVASGAALNLNDNDLVYNYPSTTGSDAQKLTDVRQLLQTGYASGAWTGVGITSTVAKTAASTVGALKTGIGYAEASTVGITGIYGGQAVDGSTVLLRYTYLGDANLDGKVNLLDFNALATNYGTGSVWTAGDYTYDGTVDTADFTALAQNYNAAALPSAVPGAVALGTLVPEPASLSLIGLAVGGLGGSSPSPLINMG